MNPDHIQCYEGPNFSAYERTIRVCYHIERSAVASTGDTGLFSDEIIAELVKQIQKEMIKDLSGYFKDESFGEEDIEYITTLSHDQLEKMRKLDELTKWMSIDEVEKVLHAYDALADLADARTRITKGVEDA